MMESKGLASIDLDRLIETAKYGISKAAFDQDSAPVVFGGRLTRAKNSCPSLSEGPAGGDFGRLGWSSGGITVPRPDEPRRKARFAVLRSA
jgi:hypothetical protein